MTSNALVTLTNQLSSTLGMGNNADELLPLLKATAFKGQVSDAQMTALIVVANQYGLNPWTKEIYAFPDKNNGIVPVVGVDGWSRIINTHAQFDGMDFIQDDNECTCRIYRKDRSHPIAVTEYMSECKRATGPWSSHPKRMLRHKAMIQAARLAFGYVGIFDQDEAERIAEIDVTPGRQTGTQAAEAARAGASWSDEEIQERDRLIADLEIIAQEGKTEAYAESWAKLTATQRKLVGVNEHDRLKKIAASIPGEAVAVE